jgi:hypothetical protein
MHLCVAIGGSGYLSLLAHLVNACFPGESIGFKVSLHRIGMNLDLTVKALSYSTKSLR